MDSAEHSRNHPSKESTLTETNHFDTANGAEDMVLEGKVNSQTSSASPNDGENELKGSHINGESNDSDPNALPEPSNDERNSKNTSSDSKPKTFKIDEDEIPDITEDGYLDVLGSGDLKKKIIREGNKAKAGRGSWATVNIVGKLPDGTVVEKYNNLTIILGDMDVVQGLDMAITLMEEGELAEVIVKPRLAYGSLGKLPDIPPEAELHYEVELLSVKADVEEMTLPLEERIQIGNEKRERGNFWYGREAYSSAIHSYRRALDFLDEEEEQLREPSEEVQKLVDLRVKVHNNLAAAQLKVKAYEAALKSVDWVLKMQPDNVKALFRRGKIYESKGMTQEAIEDMRKAMKLDPESKLIHQELSKLISQRRVENESEKALYKRMFQDHNAKLNSSPRKRSRWLVLVGSIVMAAMSVAAYYHLNSLS